MYLGNKRFRVVTVHKPLEPFFRSMDFGTKRIQRWFEKIEYEFDIEYKPGKQIVQADALSREINNTEYAMKQKDEINDMIMKIHVENDHRRNFELYKKLNVKKIKIDEIINGCEMYIKKNTGRHYKGCYIETREPGELVGFDTLEMKRGTNILLAIDYNSRMAFGMKINKRDEKEVLKLIEAIEKSIKIKKVKYDNAKEFHGRRLKEYLTKKQIDVSYSLPYYHESNGRK
ncbi:hypothetical protein BDAP_001845 [Binucleata daphniae]